MKFKKNISILLCIALLLTSVRLSFALGEDNNSNNDETINNEVEIYIGKNTTGALEETTTDVVIETNEEEATDEESTEEEATEEETTAKVIEESTSKTTIEVLEETTTEVTNETTTDITFETISTTKFDNNSTLIIEVETTSDATFVEIDDNNIATISEFNNLFGENLNSELTLQSNLETPKINNPQIHLIVARSSGFTVDLVDRSKTGKDESGLYGANPNLPDTYDSRYIENSHGVDIIPPVRNQTEFGTCWAFATIGAIETSLRAKGIITSDTEEGADLSEAALALYTIEGLKYITNNNSYIDYPGVENADYSGLNYDYYTNVSHIPVASVSFAMCGENITSALLTSSTYMGIVSENDFPHTAENIRAIEREIHSTAGLADGRKPYAFNSNRYEVINADFINKYDRDVIKEAIMKYGSVGIGYHEYRDDTNCHQASNGEWYYLSPDKSCKIEDDGSCGEEYKLGVNHAVMVVGWDDNASYDNFFLMNHMEYMKIKAVI